MWVAAVIAVVLAVVGVVSDVRAGHGTWATETVWVEPVIGTRTVWVPGYEEDYAVWVPGRYETHTRIVDEQEWRPRLVWVTSGHREDRWRWVESGYWAPGPDSSAWDPQWVWVDTSHWERHQVWVDTSRWEDHGAWVTVRREEVVTVWVPGQWETRRRSVPGYYQTEQVIVTAGHYETRRTWVPLPHPTPTPRPTPTPTPRPTARPTAPPPAQTPATDSGCTIPAGIYKVTRYYAGTDIEHTDDAIHYVTVTDGRPNDLYAVDLGSYGKGVASPYDGAAFNGRHRDVNRDLLAGTFYQNYRKPGGCYVPTSIVFFQDDRVLLTTGVRPSPTPVSSPAPSPTAIATTTPEVARTPTPAVGVSPTPVSSPAPSPTAITTTTPEVTRTPTPAVDVSPSPAPAPDPGAPVPPSQPPPGGSAPSPRPTPRPTAAPSPTATSTPQAHDPPAGTIRVAPVMAGSALAGDSEGFLAIEVLRGAPIDLWVRAATEPPSSDPGATTALQQWTFVRGVNDRPGGTRPGDTGSPNEALRLQWNDVTPIVDGQLQPYDLHLRARVRVTYSDATVQDFELEGSVAVTVRYQSATSWGDGR